MQFMQIHERLRGLREDHDMKQEAVAIHLGITRQQYGLYETGKRAFPVEAVVELCKLYHVSADYVLGLPEGLPYGKSKTRGHTVTK